MIAPAHLSERTGMNAHLFVYGTLLTAAGHPMGARLRREARLIEPATIQGRLYSLGRYPGLVEATDLHSVVHGELYALNAPAVVLHWLDAYEGVIPGRPEQSSYERAERAVRTEAGGILNAWVYLYRGSVRARPEVVGGRWVSPQV
jgi:gamma-glutamylcyclotransferase (GGCT)/AIG2-like uncharacterized protein YtfP